MIRPFLNRVLFVLRAFNIFFEKKIFNINARRTDRTAVKLNWQTTFEQSSAGFIVERNVSGMWEEVTYVPSQALGGSSNSLLSYSINDINGSKGISQYRIRMIDYDGFVKLSDIRSVRGEGQKGGTIIYPNPTKDGKLNVIFEGDPGKRNITVQDMNGRVIKEWKNYTNNNIQIDNLAPGFYTIRVVNTETGAQAVEKVIVNNR